jgi:cytochrome P450
MQTIDQPDPLEAAQLAELLDAFDVDAPALVAGLDDPYPFLAALRKATPVRKTAQFWALTRWEDINGVLRDSGTWLVDHLANATPESAPYLVDPNQGPWFQVYSAIINFRDGETHRRLRKILSPLFTPRGTEKFRDQVRATIDAQLEEAMSGDECAMDLQKDFGLPMPTRIILDILGLPQEEGYRFYETTDLIVPPPSRGTPDEWFANADEVITKHSEYVLKVAAEREHSPADDLLSRIAAVDKDGDKLDDTELMGMVAFLVAAGYETTANALSNGVYWLLRNPDQLELLRNDRSLMPSAVEEILRYEGPTRSPAPRFAAEDTEVGGELIRKGERIWLSLPAANRDPEVFEDPDDFDITRDPNPHIAFAAGPHFCVGSPLARMELQIGIEALLDRLPEMRLAGQPRWAGNHWVRGLESLPIEW